MWVWTNHMDHEDRRCGMGRARRLVWALKYITCMCEPGGQHGSLLCNHRYTSVEPRSQLSLGAFHKVPEKCWLLSDGQKSLCGQLKLSHMNCLRPNPDHLIRSSEPCQKPDEVAHIHDLSTSARWGISGQLAWSVQYSSRNNPESCPLSFTCSCPVVPVHPDLHRCVSCAHVLTLKYCLFF